MSRIAVMKHLVVLEGAGLVLVRKDGRRRWNHLNPIPLERIQQRWLSRHVGAVAARSRRLERLEQPASIGRKRTERTHGEA